MYGNGKEIAAVLPATGLGVVSQSLAIIAIVLILTGILIVVRNYRSKSRP